MSNDHRADSNREFSGGSSSSGDEDDEEDRRGEERPSVDDGGAVAGDRARDSEENGRDDAEDGDGGIEEGDTEDDHDDVDNIVDSSSSSSSDDDDDDDDDDDGDSDDESNDDGLCEYERLRLERIARNNARLAELGFNDDREMKKTNKRKSAPAQSRRSLAPDGPRRQNPGRARRATTFNESELLIELGLKRKKNINNGRGVVCPIAPTTVSGGGGKAPTAAGKRARRVACGRCDGCNRDSNCQTCVACVTGKARCIFRKCQGRGAEADGDDDDDDADDGGKAEEEEEEEDRHDTECYVCKDGGDLICCDGCEKAYHSNCHKPKIWDLPDGEWYCMVCKPMRRELEREDARVRKLTRYTGHLIADLGHHREVHCTVRFPKIECIVCEVSEVTGAVNPPDWVSCRECDDSYHLKCLDPPLENKPWGKWRCPPCKIEHSKAKKEGVEMKKANKEKAKKEKAEIPSKPLFEGEHMDDCFMCYNGGDLVCCDYCDKAYHLDCHIPPLTEIPTGLWKCQECAAVEYTRMMKCGECNACVRNDCGKCSHCLDKPKFGGPNKMKQVCLKKKCPYLRFAPPAKVSTKKASPGKTKERKKELKLQFSTGAHSTSKKRKRHNSEGAGTKIAGASVESYTLLDDLKLQSADGVSNRAVHDAAETSTNTASASVKSNTQQNDLKLQSADVISNSSVHDAPQTSMNTAGGSVESSTIQNDLELQSGNGVSNITDIVGNASKVAQKLNDNGGRTVTSRSLLTRDEVSKRKQGQPSKRRKVEPPSTAAKEQEPTPDFFADKKNDSISEDIDIEKIVKGTPLKNDPVGNKIRLIIVKALTHPAHHKIQDKACEKLRKMVASVDIVSQILHLGGLKMVSKAMRDHPERTIVQAEASALLAELVWVNPPCITDIIAEGCLSLVLISMKRHETNPKVQQMGCGFFRAMSYDFVNHPSIFSINGVVAIIDAMMKNSKKYDVLKEGCYFLQNMLCNPMPETIQSITSKRLVPIVVDAIGFAPPDYRDAACGVLANLAISESARLQIGSFKSSVFSLLAVLGSATSSVDARKYSLTALKLLATGNDDTKTEITRLGGIEKGIELLKMSNDVAIADSGLKLLGELIKDNKANAQVLADAGGFDLVTSEMGKHPNLPYIQASCCGVLRHLPVENVEQAKCTTDLILAAFKKNKEDKMLQFEGCHVMLQNCCHFPAISKLLQTKDVFPITSDKRTSLRQKVEQSVHDTSREAKQTCAADNGIINIGNNSADSSRDIDSIIQSKPLNDDPIGNKIRLVIKKALKHPDDSKVQDKACEVLRKWATSDENASKIILLGGLKMISKAMRDHPDNSIVQAEASALLAELIWVNPPCIAEIIAEGSLSLVMISMKRHENHHKVQQMGCGFFRAMSYDFANHPIIDSVNGAGAIIDSMKRNSKQYGVLKEGCYFLQNMLCNPGILPGTIQLIVSEGIALKIIDSIHEKADDDEYHGAACGLLANLTLDDGAREHIGGYDSSVSTLLVVLGLGADVDACKCSLTALKLLASGNIDIKDRIVRQGGIKTTMELLTLHNSDVVMVDSGLGLLSELTNNNSKISQLLLDSEGLEFVTKAMVHHSSSSHVQVRACEVLRNLPIGENEVNGAAQLILKAMKYRADSIVQYAGCRALLHCCCRSPATVELLQSEEVVLRRSHFTP